MSQFPRVCPLHSCRNSRGGTAQLRNYARCLNPTAHAQQCAFIAQSKGPNMHSILLLSHFWKHLHFLPIFQLCSCALADLLSATTFGEADPSSGPFGCRREWRLRSWSVLRRCRRLIPKRPSIFSTSLVSLHSNMLRPPFPIQYFCLTDYVPPRYSDDRRRCIQRRGRPYQRAEHLGAGQTPLRRKESRR